VTATLELRDITKRYGALLANDHISFSITLGKIHAVVGENGAGKTTLMRILYGEESADEGTILLRGQPISLPDPAAAIRLGIGFVHQKFMLIEPYSVVENFALGAELCRAGFFTDYTATRRRARQILGRMSMNLPLDVPVGRLSVEERQIIEIGKALYRGADILILDEPTSVLSPQKIENLLGILDMLRSEGKTIVLVTHKLAEVFKIADNISVLRRGRHIGTVRREDTTTDEIVAMMVGERTVLQVKRSPAKAGQACLSIRDVVLEENGQRLLDQISFDVHAGEILALTGVGGNGQTELVEVITGLRPLTAGHIVVNGCSVNRLNVKQRREAGMAFVPEDRYAHGSSSGQSVRDNLIMGHHRRPSLRDWAGINYRAANDFARERVNSFGILINSLDSLAQQLSGGNLQKLIVARELAFETSVIVVAYPSQGVDIRTTRFLYGQLLKRRDAGCAILLISGDLDEVFALADRIGVMARGRLVTVKMPDETSPIELGRWMTSGRPAN